ncbi:MAG: hypothetical protein A3I66_22380 [Burkholderiales bacterium RIFCSPLOWO2_02_FULL_57_36]|nr:MAG: hypothetical protein A3I66_22380 [Burkholderiales bacterium RIFCSPLOWO2_02_FULL_57_36]
MDGLVLLEAPLLPIGSDVPDEPDVVEDPELVVPEVPDEPDVPGSFVSVPVVPEPVAPVPGVPVPVLPDPVAPEPVALGLVVSAPVVPDAEPDPVVPVAEEPEPVVSAPVVPELDVLGLGVVELEVPESAVPGLVVLGAAELEGVVGVVPVVPLLCSSDLPQPANITLNNPAANMIFVV